MKKKRKLLFCLVLFLSFFFIRSDYFYAETVAQTEDDPEYWRANGLYEGAYGAEEDSVMVLGVRDEEADAKLGVDVSKYQGVIDWKKAKEEGIEFAIIRVGYRGYAAGTLSEDPYYKTNIEGALDAGIPVGVYIFSQAITEEEAIEEANFLLDRIYDYKITLPVVLDYEYTGSNGTDGRLFQANLSVEAATDICEAFLETVEDAGYFPMLYANKYMLTSKLDAEEIEEDYYIWLAHYTAQTDYEGIYDFWQYTSDGDGYKYGMQSQRLDMNYWYDDGSIHGRVYKIKYELDGGKNSSKNPSTYRNTEVALKNPKKTGYVFKGWYTDKEFKNQISTIEKGTKKDFTLYAKWEVEVKPTAVKLNKTSKELKQGKSYTLTATVSPENVTTEGVNWSSSNEKVAVVDSTGKVTAVGSGTATIIATANGDSSITAACQITVPYTISYVLNDGTNHEGNPTTYYNEEIKLQNPTRDGYTFKGWYTEKTFEHKLSVITKDTKKNLTLYAKWQAKNSIKDAQITLSKSSYTYNGKAKKPSVTVQMGNKKLVKGTDYTVSYKNNQDIGTATVTIKGKGSYTGTVKKTFTIKTKTGTVFTSGKYNYKVTGTSTVAFTGLVSTSTTKINIPKTATYGGKSFKVTSIASGALKKNTKLTSVTIGDNVKTIGTSAFLGCTKLSTVKIGNGVTKIGTSAFSSCKKLSKVTMGSSVKTISSKAFKNCTALKSITLPTKVKNIGKWAFYGCKNLKTITIKSTKLEAVGEEVFKGINSKATIKVPKSKLSSYKKLLKGKGQSSKVTIVKYK